ncbi:hypothetical protein JW998_05050 [candidate division KSB1 bacterium]|nr:hypothetical protein [candidate division KSB1 bacterium]
MKHEHKNNKFDVGGYVQVKPANSIAKYLESGNKTEGCLFMDQMWDLCGQKFKVLQVVDNFFAESHFGTGSEKSSLYILDGVICDGSVEYFNHPCDCSCYLFWHENWLAEPENGVQDQSGNREGE